MRFAFALLILWMLMFLGCVAPPEEKENITPKYTPNVSVNITPAQDENVSMNVTAKELEEVTVNATLNKTLLPTERLLDWTKTGKVLDDCVSSNTIVKDGSYRMYCTAREGIYLAESYDGVNWVKKGAVLRPDKDQPMVSNSALIELKNGKYRMLYEVKTGKKMKGEKEERKLYSAFSEDGLYWHKEPGVRFFDYGEAGNIFTSVPDVLWFNDTLRMYYTAGLTSRIAVSYDEGLTWTKEKNIELENITIVLDPDIIRLKDGTYKLFFSTFPSGQFGVGKQIIMSASSADGVNFLLDEGTRIEPDKPNGMLVDPDVVETPAGYRMYYGQWNGQMFDVYSAISEEKEVEEKNKLIFGNGSYVLELEDVVVEAGETCAAVELLHANQTSIKKAKICEDEDYYWTAPDGHTFRIRITEAVAGQKGTVWANVFIYG